MAPNKILKHVAIKGTLELAVAILTASEPDLQARYNLTILKCHFYSEKNPTFY